MTAHALVLAHHLLHVVRPHRVLAGWYRVLHVVRSHLMIAGGCFGEGDARNRNGDRRAKGDELMVGRHGRTSWGIKWGNCMRPAPPRRMIQIMRPAIFPSSV